MSTLRDGPDRLTGTLQVSSDTNCPSLLSPQKKKVDEAAKGRKRRRAPAQSTRRRRPKLDKEVEQQMKEEEEEEELEVTVEYMDSDEEVKKRKPEEETEQPSQEEEEEVVVFSPTPLQEWIPAEQPGASSALLFRPAEFPSSRQVQVQVQERSTVLGQYGRSVLLGAPPAELPPHLSSSSLMVSSARLQTHLSQQAGRFQPTKASPGGVLRPSRRRTEYELKAAVVPWVGNLVLLSRSRRSTAEELRERAQRRALSSTPVFLLLLQTMKVDSEGCLETIRRRRSEATSSPAPPPAPPHLMGPKTLVRMRQRRRLKEQQDLDREQVQQHQKLLQPLPAVPPQEASAPRTPPPPHRKLLLRPVFIPASLSSVQLLCPASIRSPPPHLIMAVPRPAPPTPTAPPAAGQMLVAPGACPAPHTGVCSWAFPPSVPPPDSTDPPPPVYDHDYTLAPNSTRSPGAPTRRKRRGEEEPHSRSSSELQPRPAALGGKRLRRPSQKARAFQEAARAKVRRCS